MAENAQIQHPEGSAVFLVGGGIASLAAALFLIRDAGWDGSRIIGARPMHCEPRGRRVRGVAVRVALGVPDVGKRCEPGDDFLDPVRLVVPEQGKGVCAPASAG